MMLHHFDTTLAWLLPFVTLSNMQQICSSNFTFGHNVFKSRLLLLRQNASAGGKGLKKNIVPMSNLSFYHNVFNSIQLFIYLFIYLLGFYAAFNIISVISRRQFTYSWSLGKETSTRLENVSCPRALHNDRSAATGDGTRDTQFRNPRR